MHTNTGGSHANRTDKQPIDSVKRLASVQDHDASLTPKPLGTAVASVRMYVHIYVHALVIACFCHLVSTCRSVGSFHPLIFNTEESRPIIS